MKRSSSLVAIGFLMAVIGATPAHLRSQATTGATAAASDSVRLDTGLVSGTAGTSAEIRVCKGIPFEAPPVGALRWRAPQPAPDTPRWALYDALWARQQGKVKSSK